MNQLQYQRRAASNAVLIVITVLLLVAAFFVYRWMSSDSDGGEKMAFVCTNCKHRFELTAGAYNDLLDARKVETDPRTKTIYLRCPKCKQFKAVDDNAESAP